MKYYVGCSELNAATILRQIRKEKYSDGNIKKYLSLSKLDSNNYLSDYSLFFNFIEVNLYQWSNSSASYTTEKILSDVLQYQKFQLLFESRSDFRFSFVVPKQVIDNKKNYGSCALELETLLQKLIPMKNRIITLVLQIPSNLSLAENRGYLESILHICCEQYGYRVSIEFDHYSWYQDLTYNILKKYNASLIWSDKHRYQIFTSNFLYVRTDQNLKRWLEKLIEKNTEQNHIGIKGIKENNLKNEIVKFAILVVESNNLEKIDFALRSLKNSQIKKNNKYENIKNDNRKWIGRAIFHIDINSFYSSCEEIKDPSLKGKPHAVIMTDQENNYITKGVVAACSYEAKRFGVHSAIPLYKALELCPNLILRRVDKKYYSKISEKVMKILEQYSDKVEQTSIDEAYLDCTDVTNSEVILEEYAKEIKRSIKEKCKVLTSVGIAPTKYVAKIASDYHKPDGLIIVHYNKLKKFLYPLKVARISGIGTKTQKILEEMKIETIGQLANTDVQILIERFGKKTGIWMRQVARGEDKELVLPRGDHTSISNETTLSYFTKDKEQIKQSLYELVDQLYEKISTDNYHFKTVGIKLVTTDYHVESREISYKKYQNDRKCIESTIDKLLNKVIALDSKVIKIKQLTELLPVRKIGLRVSNLTKTENKTDNIQSQQKTLLDYFE